LLRAFINSCFQYFVVNTTHLETDCVSQDQNALIGCIHTLHAVRGQSTHRAAFSVLLRWTVLYRLTKAAPRTSPWFYVKMERIRLTRDSS